MHGIPKYFNVRWIYWCRFHDLPNYCCVRTHFVNMNTATSCARYFVHYKLVYCTVTFVQYCICRHMQLHVLLIVGLLLACSPSGFAPSSVTCRVFRCRRAASFSYSSWADRASSATITAATTVTYSTTLTPALTDRSYSTFETVFGAGAYNFHCIKRSHCAYSYVYITRG